jgi:ABC-type multidrug transport system ATPase subunit
LNIITGILKPSSGNATIYGADLVDDIETVRQSLGLCQQFDVLFDVLTVREHLKLAWDLKNVPRDQVQRDIQDTLDIVMLTEHD